MQPGASQNDNDAAITEAIESVTEAIAEIHYESLERSVADFVAAPTAAPPS